MNKTSAVVHLGEKKHQIMEQYSEGSVYFALM